MANFQGTKINPDRFSRTQLKFYFILIPLSIFMILPVVFIFNQAFKPFAELFAFPQTLFVRRPTFNNFKMLWSVSSTTGVPMSRYLLNSVFVSLVTVFVTIIITVCSAYALSKKNFKLKEPLFKLNQFALMFVPIAVAVPRYLIISKVGLMNTMLVHILPMLAMPIVLFLVKQFIDQLPDALIEAAKIDGANDFVIVTKIVFPLVRPAVATVAILTFQAVWNATESSGTFIDDETIRTIAFYMSSISQNNAVQASGIAAAAGLIMFLPNFIIFLVMQSQVMSTMSHSGIK